MDEDYIYMITNDGKVPYESSHMLHVSKNMWYSMAPNRL